MTNTTYVAPSSMRSGDERASRSRTRPSARASASDQSDQRAVGSGAGSGVAGAGAAAASFVGNTVDKAKVLLERLPFPSSYLAIAVAAIVLAIIVCIGVSTCSSGAVEEQPAAGEGEQVEQQAGDDINADIPEDLRWRDADFAVDPSRTTWSTNDNGRKVVYLTIDDGPSSLTEEFLDLLDEYNCKATFFVTGQNPEYYPLIHEAYKRGHTIGLHSMSHNYAQVYASQEAFMSDLDAIGQVVKDQIGYVPCFIRFPGGSSNTQADNYSQGLMPKLVSEVQKQGYQYYDWSADTGDGADMSADQMIDMVESADLDTNVVLLCHDSATKESTLEALPKIIKYYQDKGYTFEALDRESWVCHHSVYVDETATAAGAAAAGTAAADGTSADTTDTTDTTQDVSDGESAYDDAIGDETYDDGTYDDTSGETYDDGTAEETYYEEDAESA